MQKVFKLFSDKGANSQVFGEHCCRPIFSNIFKDERALFMLTKKTKSLCDNSFTAFPTWGNSWWQKYNGSASVVLWNEFAYIIFKNMLFHVKITLHICVDVGDLFYLSTELSGSLTPSPPPQFHCVLGDQVTLFYLPSQAKDTTLLPAPTAQQLPTYVSGWQQNPLTEPEIQKSQGHTGAWQKGSRGCPPNTPFCFSLGRDLTTDVCYSDSGQREPTPSYPVFAGCCRHLWPSFISKKWVAQWLGEQDLEPEFPGVHPGLATYYCHAP